MMQLKPDQEDAVTWLVEHDHTLLVAPMGAGKTAVVLHAVSELMAMGEVRRVLVVAPLAVAQATWPEEAAAWHFDGVRLALGGPEARLAAFEDPEARLVVTNYDNLKWACEQCDIGALFDGLVIDEGTKMASTGGVGYRRFRKWIPSFRWRVVMSGTPVAQGLDKLFGQMLLVDGGATLGGSKQRYLETWFQPVDYERRRWEPNPLLAKELLKRVKPWVHVMPDYREELPELMESLLWVDLDEAAREVYQTLRRDMVIDLGEDVSAANMAVLQGKLGQVASGAVYDESGSAAWVHNAKWDALAQAIADSDGPVLVVYQWAWQREILEFRWGAQPFMESLLVRWNRGVVPIMAVHPKSCGHGLNLQHGGCELISLGPLWSRDQWDQVVGRLWRRGQDRPVRVRTICARGTVDEDTLARLEGHRRWMPMLLDGVA